MPGATVKGNRTSRVAHGKLSFLGGGSRVWAREGTKSCIGDWESVMGAASVTQAPRRNPLSLEKLKVGRKGRNVMRTWGGGGTGLFKSNDDPVGSTVVETFTAFNPSNLPEDSSTTENTRIEHGCHRGEK